MRFFTTHNFRQLEAKFTFKIRNILEMEEWKNKTTLQLASTDSQLGITKAMLTSECPARGYDMSKVKGYDPNRIIGIKGWQIIKHFVLRMMDEAEFGRLEGHLQKTGQSMNAARMKILRNAASGTLK